MQIVIGTALVPFDGIIGVDDVVVVVNVQLLIVVLVLEIVRRRRVDHTRRTLPAVVAVSKTQEFVEGRKRTDALDVLQVKAPLIGRPRRKFDGAAQPAARLVDRRGAVQQRGVVDEVGGDHRKIGHAQHRRVDAHAVPRHLRMRGRGAAKRHGRKGRTTVLLDENRRVEGQNVGHRQGDIFVEHRRIELGFLHADLFQRPPRRYADFADRYHERGVVVPPPFAGFAFARLFLLPVTNAGGQTKPDGQ